MRWSPLALVLVWLAACGTETAPLGDAQQAALEPAPPAAPPTAPEGSCFLDRDGDGHGDPGSLVPTAEADGSCTKTGTDCDDLRSDIHPGQPEQCDEVDNDCDGTIDQGLGARYWLDADGDGFGDPNAERMACVMPAGHSHQAGDCDDTLAQIHPQATERCNGMDDDCDDQVDEEGAEDALPFLIDADGDGHGDPTRPVTSCRPGPGLAQEAAGLDCDDSSPAVYPGAVERCNGMDDDCDGQVDEDHAVDVVTWHRDADDDGYGHPTQARVACSAPDGWLPAASEHDCDDGHASVYPGAAEHCNGLDDDCDGHVDEDDAVDTRRWYADTDGDGHGDPAISLIACQAPRGYVASDDDCDDLRITSSPDGVEVCNRMDDDCDGSVDEDDAQDAGTWFRDGDGDGFGDPEQAATACSRPRGWVDTAGDCDDTRAAAHPEATEVCNGRDDDCDGSTDEPDADDAFTWYADEDRDGHGAREHHLDACYQPSGYVSTRDDCDDGDATVHPGASETPDGIDNDCNGTIDDFASGG